MPTCGCCKKAQTFTGEFPCRCMQDGICKTCNRCVAHCQCTAERFAPADPYPEQLRDIRTFWRQNGVTV